MKAREIVEGELSLDQGGQTSFGFLWYLSSSWLFAGGWIPCFVVVVVVIIVVVVNAVCGTGRRETIGSIAKDSSGRLF